MHEDAVVIGAERQTAGATPTNYCSQCGARLARDARFCSACGAKIAETADPHGAGGPVPSAAATASPPKRAGASATRSAPAAPPAATARAPRTLRDQVPGLVVLTLFLAVGLAIWVRVLEP